MSDFNSKTHWETIYATKKLSEVSWYQPVPETSLQFLADSNLPKDAKIIDVGGGDSFFVDHLLEAGYTDITVVDISVNALERVKDRLGEKAKLVKWIVGDITQIELTDQYDFWHDRAVFHFLTHHSEIETYQSKLDRTIQKGGFLVLGTFSENGPTKCSGIEIKQYSEKGLTEVVSESFERVACLNVDHQTPFNTIQNFVFCSFRKV
jgi:ubiquinone/menaquinone biosynthesis C-methylase UbiE